MRNEINFIAVVFMYDCIIAGISEIWTKSEGVRRLLIKRLTQHIKSQIPELKIEVRRGRFILKPYSEDYVNKLLKIFGIKFCAPSFIVPTEYDKILGKLAEIIESRKNNFSYKLEVKRVWKGYPMTSVDLKRKLGKELEEKIKHARVDIHNPDLRIFVELHKDLTIIYYQKFEGVDGYPVGTQGKALALFSGGIDSPVAAWLAAKRGLLPILFTLNVSGSAHQTHVLFVYSQLLEWIPSAKLYVIDAMDLREAIINNVRNGYRQMIFKVFLYKVAEAVARKLNVKAVITGESLGQVSTQTLDSLEILDKFVNILFLRPLIGMNKEEITKLAGRIGTFDISSTMVEFCMLEKHATAQPKEEIVKQEFEKVLKIITIDKLLQRLRLLEEP